MRLPGGLTSSGRAAPPAPRSATASPGSRPAPRPAAPRGRAAPPPAPGRRTRRAAPRSRPASSRATTGAGSPAAALDRLAAHLRQRAGARALHGRALPRARHAGEDHHRRRVAQAPQQCRPGGAAGAAVEQVGRLGRGRRDHHAVGARRGCCPARRRARGPRRRRGAQRGGRPGARRGRRRSASAAAWRPEANATPSPRSTRSSAWSASTRARSAVPGGAASTGLPWSRTVPPARRVAGGRRARGSSRRRRPRGRRRSAPAPRRAPRAPPPPPRPARAPPDPRRTRRARGYPGADGARRGSAPGRNRPGPADRRDRLRRRAAAGAPGGARRAAALHGAPPGRAARRAAAPAPRSCTATSPTRRRSARRSPAWTSRTTSSTPCRAPPTTGVPTGRAPRPSAPPRAPRGCAGSSTSAASATDPTCRPHLASRQEVGRALAASGVPTVELRAGIVIGSGSTSFEMIRALVDRLPVMITPRWVETAHPADRDRGRRRLPRRGADGRRSRAAGSSRSAAPTRCPTAS